MNGENKMWSIFWACCAAVLITIITSITWYWHNVNVKIVEGVARGEDPIAMSCALDPMQQMCHRVVQQKTY